MDGFSRLQTGVLARLSADAPFDEQLALLRRDGVLILENALSPDQVRALNAELGPWFERTPGGEGAFFGRGTKRFGAVLAKSPAALALVLHERILALCERALIADDIGPARCDCIQLNLAQAISIGPGEPEQVVHRDQQLFCVETGYELLTNTMFCLDDFTRENGGTWFVPGSCHWAPDRWPQPHEIVAAEAPAGSAVLWLGSMMHAGGANRTDRERRGLIVSYNHAWLAQTEKLMACIPPDIARTLPQRAQRLLGYQVHKPNLGWIEGRDPLEWLTAAEPLLVGACQDHLHPGHVAIVEGYYAQRAGGAA